MQYGIYKFNFTSAVHFGDGMLNESGYSFPADRLFSALYIEALKYGLQDQLLSSAEEGKICFSDCLPFVKETYLIPKPIMYIAPQDQGDSVQKKFFKNLKYIPASDIDLFVSGKFSSGQNIMDGFGKSVQRNNAAVSLAGDTEPYYVGTWEYAEGNGLYVIVGFETDNEKELADQLLKSLSYTGIGGKKSSGLGKFILEEDTAEKGLSRLLQKKAGSDRWMLLCGALPEDEELEQAVDGATYLLELRSGYVASETHSPEQVRKKDIYVMAAGSCFTKRFSGGIYNVSKGGTHPVYRYEKAMFIGL